MSNDATIGPGSVIPARKLTAVSGDAVAIPDPERLVHLQLRRFAGCPICNVHLQSIVRRHEEIAKAGVREVVVFHSTDEELARYVDDLPFAVVGDPDKALYAEFGVGTSPRAVLDPRSLAPVLAPIAREQVGRIRTRRPLTNPHPTGGRLGLPGDFLIGTDGKVLVCKRGRHANDQWTVDEVLAHAYSANA
ncbi:alkyl hydroperoxide reductase [Mycobacterium alsense]|uniref:AhpC/TSA family protein n=1 Tax=Mycobacterium alsense TaxID=324058 RepID=A0AA41XND6_9MYCO|nr:peroxiredoxin-like family protein [Mycobacterium alsense]MCV7378948.1 AhpC/TSA family protein [Mycobacterium alsense]OQZ91681.1 alkyl hydroperoxide reductase [Mycobacterium alsense]